MGIGGGGKLSLRVRCGGIKTPTGIDEGGQEPSNIRRVGKELCRVW